VLLLISKLYKKRDYAMPEFTEVNKHDKLFSEMALRLVGFDKAGLPFSFGTAFVIQPYLLVTARHVVEAFISSGTITKNKNEVELTFWAIQIEWDKGNHKYNIWQVVKAYFSPHSDICLLHVGAYNDTAAQYKQWKTVPVSLMPPEIGAEVIGFGFHATKFERSKVTEACELEHLELNDTSSKSTGRVKQLYMIKRDSTMLSFPCFEVDARFDPGMSGGLVINSKSELCGIICSSMPLDKGHYSHVAMIWPIMAIEVDFGNSNHQIHGTQTLSKLVEIGKWKPIGWENVKVQYVRGERYAHVTYNATNKL
jgi:hypothetical protein